MRDAHRDVEAFLHEIDDAVEQHQARGDVGVAGEEIEQRSAPRGACRTARKR